MVSKLCYSAYVICAQTKYEEQLDISAPSVCDPNTGLVPYFYKKKTRGTFDSYTRGLDCRELRGESFNSADEAMEHAKTTYERDLESQGSAGAEP